jgi:hypothetical protein
MLSAMTERFFRLVSTTKFLIEQRLQKGSCNRRELEKYLREMIKTPKDDALRKLAVILSFKELEVVGKITISRPRSVPFPMTDFNTTFTLGGKT